MPRRRDRGSVERLELWSPNPSTPRIAPSAYVTIARIFEQVDRVMLDEIEEDILRCVQPEDESHPQPFSTSRFINLRTHKDSESYFEDVRKGISHTSSDTDTFAYLTDTKCVTTWSWVHSAVLKHQDDSDLCFHLSWTQAKARANEILNLALAVLETYDSDEYQAQPGRESVGAGIEAKLRTLLLFDTIWSRPTSTNTETHTDPSNHEFARSFNQFLRDRKDTIKARKRAGYDRTHQTVSTL